MRIFAKETITPLALNIGDQFEFVLKNKMEVSFKIGETSFWEIERVEKRGVIYGFACDIMIDGVLVKLERFVSCQQAFYVPFVVNGVRIWLNDVRKIFDHLTIRDTDTRSLPDSDVRLAIQDASLDICPEKMVNWFRSDKPFLLIEECFGGDDCWLGVYRAQGCHGGLDINMLRGLDLIAPISLDHQFLAHSLEKGFNNNRWLARRDWRNGDTWFLWSSHLINMIVEEGIPLEKGTAYAKAAGVRVGGHDHSHFEFWIISEEKGKIHLDPWILFWQIFENIKKDSQKIVPRISFDPPVEVNKEIKFNAKESLNLQAEDQLLWSFGDGFSSMEKDPGHIYRKPGVFEVVLTVVRGAEKISTAVYLIIKGSASLESAVNLPVYCYGFENYRNPFLINIEVNNTPRTKNIRLPLDIDNGNKSFKINSNNIFINHTSDNQLLLEINGANFGEGETLIPLENTADKNLAYLLSINKSSNSVQKLVYEVRDEEVHLDSNAWFGHRFCENKITPKEFYVTNGGRSNQGKIEFNLNIPKGKHQVFVNKNTAMKFLGKLKFEIISNVEKSSHEVVVKEDGCLGEFLFNNDLDNQLVILNQSPNTKIIISDLTFINQEV